MVKPGYKLTEVGEIPEDWEVRRLKEVANVTSGGTPSRSNPMYWNGNIPWITTGQINFNRINTANEYITKEGVENSAARVYDINTLLMAMYGQGKTRGRIAILGITAAINQACAAISVLNILDYEYLFFNLSYRYESIRNMSNTGNQENLNIGIIESIPIPLPPLDEQRAIADALSDMDDKIAALDAAIAKKRDIKQGAMQRLLTGQERLPGFTGEWEVKRLGEVAEIRTGAKNTQDKVDDGLYPFFVRSATVEKINSFSFDGEAVLTAGDGVGTGKIYHYINGKFDFHQRVYMISNFIDKLHGYFFYLYFSTHFYDRIMSMTAKSSVDSIRYGMIAGMLIPIPSLEEQQAIAAVLSDMDAEITSLEADRDKAITVKQGMMQDLLTGRKRLL